MPIILNFSEKETEELKRFWSNHTIISNDKNREGKSFLIGKKIYKIYNKDYLVENPICRNDLPLESFLFPEEIYTCNNKVFAYRTPYIQNNQFKIETFRNWTIPNIKMIKKALIPLIEDIYVLSKNNIEAIDLAWRNTLFDGEKIYIIDTLDYQIVDEDTEKDNLNSLKNIITCLIANVELAHDAYHTEISDEDLNEYKNLHQYTKEIYQEVKEKYKDKEIKKVKK